MAREFDGTNQYLRQTSGSPWDGNFPVSVSLWFQDDQNTGGSSRWVFSFGDQSSSSNYFGLATIVSASKRVLRGQCGSGITAFTTGTVDVQGGAWHHACIVQAAVNDMKVWLDGADLQTDTDTLTDGLAVDQVAIGVLARSSLAAYWDGAAEHVAAWNTALATDNVYALASGASPLFVQPSSLLMYNDEIDNDADRFGAVSFTAVNTPTWRDARAPVIMPRKKRIVSPSPQVSYAPRTQAVHWTGEFIQPGADGLAYV